MYKIRKTDTVKVIKGKDVGKVGRVLAVFPKLGKAIVEGVNLVKKHRRPRRQDEQAGIISLEAPISISNLMFLCKHCNRPTRVGFRLLSDGTKVRFCKLCNEVI
ncbi:MAG: 50S ribosomal protein L24 [Candidatus Omnitrophica bacterium]|nr:50S ribosomal protein L24 [Candidatus Omnitrophota bacterium]